MKKLTLTAIVLLFIGCAGIQATLGIADRSTMMSKWQGADRDVELLSDINGWCNYQAKADPGADFGRCADQADLKMEILKDLNIPAKRMHCTVEGQGHAFVIATLDRDYLMDNGTVNDVVWVKEEILASTWGVEGVEAW